MALNLPHDHPKDLSLPRGYHFTLYRGYHVFPRKHVLWLSVFSKRTVLYVCCTCVLYLWCAPLSQHVFKIDLNLLDVLCHSERVFHCRKQTTVLKSPKLFMGV
jgi:hypothetical protein